MNTFSKIITGISTATMLATGAYFYANNAAVKQNVDGVVKPFFGIVDTKVTPKIHNSVFLTIDGSGSGHSTFSVPKVDTTYVSTLIDKIRTVGSGDLWISYIDGNARNNEVIYLAIPQAFNPPAKPTRNMGESMKSFSERIFAYKNELKNFEAEAPELHKRFELDKQLFLQKTQRLISTAYTQKNSSNDWSDVTGSVNVALRTLETVTTDASLFRTILLVSDARQSLPAGVPSEQMQIIPADINVVLVNAAGSPGNVLTGHATEVESLDRALTKVIHVNKIP